MMEFLSLFKKSDFMYADISEGTQQEIQHLLQRLEKSLGSQTASVLISCPPFC